MDRKKVTPIILAGGSGTRLWPLSRENLPKQFHRLIGKKTMFQETLTRLDKNFSNKPLIICSENYKYIVQDQALEIKKECEIYLEPIPKNTAPAITLVSLSQKLDTILLVLAADHFIGDINLFNKTIENSIELAENNKIVTFGIKPTSANTSYGYINTLNENDSELKIINFKEKPDLETAQQYFKNENYFWNSGIFLFKVKALIDEVKRFHSNIFEICYKTHKSIKNEINFNFYDCDVFSKCPSVSIDYAIMENTNQGVMVPLNNEWSDVGSWKGLMDTLEKNEERNVIKGDVVSHNTEDSLIYNLGEKLVVTNDIKNLVIVDTKDSLLVSSSADTDSIKKLYGKIKKKHPNKVKFFPDENRPWGSFEVLVEGTGFKVKKIIIKPGGQLSLQKHKFRSEHWVIVSGEAEVIKGEKKIILGTNESIYIARETIHSIGNKSDHDLIIIEVQTGSYFGEDDIERFSDIYGRK